ncbi:MAG: ATP-binding protein [Proteobacteria bacterium]|nr:ATP-binding protein [Pseudomonadota bacterium]
MKPYRNLQNVESDLKKRVQELECLYNIGPEIRSDGDLAQNMTMTAIHLVQGLQFPEIASAAIWLDGAEYSASPGPKEEAAVSLAADILVAGKNRGFVEVHYKEDAQFLKEEKRLVEEVSSKISKYLERRELHAKLQKYVDELQELIEEKQKYVGNLTELVEEKTRELQNSKKRYEDFFKDAPVPLIISRLNGDIIKANREFYHLLDYPEDGSVHLNYVRDRLYENPAVRTVIFQKLEEDGKIEALDLAVMDRHGNPIPVITSCLFIDMDGEKCVETVYKDIRIRKELERKLIEQNENLERKVLERTVDLENQKNLLIKKNQELMTLTEKLRESKTRLQALFKTITDTVVVLDADFNILMSNQKSIGSKGKCYKKVFGQDQRCEECLAIRVFEEKTSVTQEKVVGDEYYLLQAYPIFGRDCEVTGSLEISRVVTKEKNMEKQLLQADKLASLGQLVSGIGHEINNPNTFIRGNLHIMQEAMNDIFPILNAYYQSHPDLKIARLSYDIFKENIPILIDDMVQGSNRIKGIVEGLKKFAKRDEGFLNEIVSLNTITEACLRLVDNQIRRTADVKIDLDPELPTVVGNSQKLQQVIVNILINASQAIEKPRGTIHVLTRFNEKEVVLRVKDNGKGMSELTVKQIFDPFFTTKRHQGGTSGGTGLGLSIAYGIIKEHQGRIDVESKEGIGTTFCIYLPRSPEEGK